MKKTIATFVLGGLLTAGAFSLVYELPISGAAEKVAPGIVRELDQKATGETPAPCNEQAAEAIHCN
jgi:hypothetical protein